jgi:hypothetical protein
MPHLTPGRRAGTLFAPASALVTASLVALCLVLPVAAQARFEVGIVSGSDHLGETKVVDGLGAKVVRLEFPVGRPAAALRPAIAAHAAHGTRVLALAGFAGRMPTAAEARNVASWAKAYGPGGSFWAGRTDGRLAMRHIEFGNETSFGYQYGDQYDKPSYVVRARRYARRLRDAHRAVRGANPRVGLLAQADDANTGSSAWVDGLFDAVPGLGKRVAGWTIHPYGPREKWAPRMDRLVAQTASRGARSSIPIYVTEWGLSTDGGRCLSDNYGWDRCMTYAAAATTLKTELAEMRARYGSRLRAVFLYQARDQTASGTSSNREHYFGALRSDLTDKGPYSATVRSLLAGS